MRLVIAIALLAATAIIVVLFAQHEADRRAQVTYSQELRAGKIPGCPLVQVPLFANGTDCPG